MRRALAALILLVLVTPAWAQDSPLVEAGRQAFTKNGCHGCHTIGRAGTPIGPDLSRIGARYSPVYLEWWLQDPTSVRPSAHMPMLELTEEDLRALAVYLGAQR
jgi:cytochrome c oxidase subunit 2